MREEGRNLPAPAQSLPDISLEKGRIGAAPIAVVCPHLAESQ